jgi:hypothetical protein
MDDIIRQIERAYGSLSDPKYFFVGKALDDRPYDDLVASVTRGFKVTEDTDEDDDLAFNYLLSRDGQRWNLSISMVGPYAVLARISTAWDDILVPTTLGLSDAEWQLIEGLTAAGLRLLSQEELERPVGLRVDGLDDVRLYQALFTTLDGLPWDKDALRRLGLID